MTIKLLRCAICDDWHSPKHHCFNCGAHQVTAQWDASHKVSTKHFNREGIEMVRGVPRSIEHVINMRYES